MEYILNIVSIASWAKFYMPIGAHFLLLLVLLKLKTYVA